MAEPRYNALYPRQSDALIDNWRNGTMPETLSAYNEPWYRALPNYLTDKIYGPNATMAQGNTMRHLAGTENPLNLPGQFSEGLDTAAQGYRMSDPKTAALGAFQALTSVPGGGNALHALPAIFAGAGALTANKAMLHQAETMAAKNLPREQIWKETGWFRGVDGKWRFEIDDSGAKFATPATWPTVNARKTISDSFLHPDLYAAYPDNKPVLGPTPAGNGAFNPSGNEVLINGVLSKNAFGTKKDFDRAVKGQRRSTLHELQHWVQDNEGLAPGGAPNFDAKNGFDAYRRLAGEVEARTVQKRMDMTPEQRAARPPWLDYDVPESRQIVRMGNSGPQMSVPERTAANALMPQEAKGITAYHGSPHDFDRFDMAKIGTGEGAQAYGHGLYFADNEGVAFKYKEDLSGGRINRSDPQYMAEIAHEVQPSDPIGWLQAERKKLEPSTQPLNKIQAPRAAAIDAAIAMHQSGQPIPHTRGRMYEVKINADPEHFLDWDKPLSQQSERVKTAWDTFINSPEGRKYAQELGTASNLKQHKFGGELRGQDLLQNVMGAHEARNDYRQAATDYYKKQGIPGIKYLDQGSRAVGEGSRNYVVFDEKLIEIMRKYGLLPPVAAAGAAGAAQAPNALYDGINQ